MPDLEPITREEMLLDGEDLEPITRKEMFIKRIYDKTQVIPEPITREEMFLKKAGDETTDVTIEQLNVSENGTYSEEGVAYNPVIVNVPAPPIPDNAYLLNEVEGLPKDIVTFDDGSNLPMPKLEVAVEPQQDLHGYDSPWVGGAGKNKLPYFTAEEKNGIRLTYDNGVVILNGTASANVFFTLTGINLASNIYTFSANNSTTNNGVHVSLREIGADSDFTDLPMNSLDKHNTYQNVSIGQVTLYVLSGTQLTNFKLPLQIEVGGSKTTFAPYSNICPISGWDEVDVTVADDVENPTVSNVYTIDLGGTRYGGEVDVVSGIVTPAPYYASYNGETLTGEWISDRDKYEVGATPTIGAQVVNIGASGTPVSTLPTAIKSLRGVNNVYANTGKILEAEYFTKGE